MEKLINIYKSQTRGHTLSFINPSLFVSCNYEDTANIAEIQYLTDKQMAELYLIIANYCIHKKKIMSSLHRLCKKISKGGKQ